MMQEDLIRFLKRVDQCELVDQCWNWMGNKDWKGYGRFWHEGKGWLAHRWIYTYFFGKITERLQLDHLCRNKSCVNPQHLEVVDQSTNMLRAELFAGIKTHCKHGHEFSKENTRVITKLNGLVERVCRACDCARRK